MYSPQTDLRKRKVDSGDYQLSNDNSATTISREKKSVRREGTTSSDLTNSVFRNNCNHCYIESLKLLNQWFYKQLKDHPPEEENDENDFSNNSGPPSFLYINLVSEYRRSIQDIQRRYHSYVPLGSAGSGAGEVVAMGSDDGNQLGFTDSGDVDDDNYEKKTEYLPFLKRNFPELRNNQFRAISAGGMHSVALSIDGNVYTWGTADDGTIGRDVTDTTPEHTPGIVSGFMNSITGVQEDGTIIQIATGDSHTLFLTLAGNVYQCGTYKDMDSGKYSDPVMGIPGTEAVEGCNPKPVHVYQIKSRVKEIFAKQSLNVALLEDDTIVTWGFGNKGELARSATMNATKNDMGVYDLTKPYFYTNDGPNLQIVKDHFLKPQPPIWNGGVNQKKIVIHVATGAFHLLVAARDPKTPGCISHVYSSGLNNYGQLGHGDVGGNTDRHELTLVEALKDKNIAKLAAGQHHSLALNLHGTELYSFGRADYGQLGLGKTKFGESVSIPSVVKFPPRENTNPPEYQVLVEIAAGDQHSMARTIENEIYTWGFNESGATGHPSSPDDDNDIVTPTLLNIEKHIQTSRAPHARVYNICGGGQHSLFLVKTYQQQQNTSTSNNNDGAK